MEPLLPEIPAWWLIGFGLVLMGAELFLTLFVLLFIGLGFVLVGLASFVWHPSGETQLLSAMLIGSVLTYALRGFFLRSLNRQTLALETLQTGETGELFEYQGHLRVLYKGTSWAIQQTPNPTLKAGDLVVVTELKNNVAQVAPLKDL